MAEKEYLFIRRPKFAIVISLAIVLAGIITLMGLPLEEYPSISPPQVVVSAQYPGASSDVIESTIAAPLEAQLNGVENMIYMSSSSQNGSYQLTLFFEVGSDPDMAVINVQNRLQLVTPRLPEEVRRYGMTVRKSTGGPGLLLIAIDSPNGDYDPLFLANYASIYVKDELARIKGVSSVSVFGSGDYSMRIWLDPSKMAALKISIAEVSNAISNQNAQPPAGAIGVEPMENDQLIKLTLRTKGRLKEVSEFENIVVRSNTGADEIRLKDIAKVELASESYTYFARREKRNVAMLSIKQLPEANSIDLSNKLSKRLEELSKSFPAGMEYSIVRDETEFVRESIKEVVQAIVLAILLVTIVCYLFLGSFRASLVPFFAIPVSLVGTFIFIGMFGFSINLLMLFGMVLAVGLVVDDAIVVLENAQRHIQEGKTPRDATEVSMKEVTGAVIATSLVLMAVFVPVCFMPGVTGKMYQQFALCIAVSIGLSSVAALTLSPALCSTILKSKDEFKELDILVKFDNWFNKIRDKYLVGAKYFIENPKNTLIFFLSLILFAFVLFKIIPTGFLPEEDKGAVFMQVQLPDGASLSRTDKLVRTIEEDVRTYKGVTNTMAIVGFAGENTAFIVLELDNWSKRKLPSLSSSSILGKIRRKYGNYPYATIAAFSPPSVPGLGMFGGFEYQLLDKADRTPQELYAEAMKLLSATRSDSKLSGVYSQYTADLPQLMIDVDFSKAMAQNVSVSEIYNTLSAQFATYYVNDFNKYGRVYRVLLQANDKYRATQNDIEKIFVKNQSGSMTPLKNVATVREVTGPSSITRFNMYKAVTINGSAARGVSSGVAMNEMERLSNSVLPKDMGFAWSGISLQEKDSSGQVGIVLLMALTFVYLFLVALYESWTLPMAVMLISPVAIVGALFFQYVFGYSLDIYSQIGLVMLIGMSTKQAILIVEFAKDAREKSDITVEEAAMAAAKLRFRAVMMTSIAFILGVLPLVLAMGAGAASRHSVGMTVFGGMIAVACIGVLLVPAFYVLINKMKEITYKKFNEFNNKKKGGL